MMEIRKVGVLGCGIMGSGIAQVMAQKGIPVTSWDVSDEALARGRAAIGTFLDKGVARGKVTPEGKASTLAAIRWTRDLGDLSGADLLIEAVVEDLGVKKDLFARMDAVARKGAILATNTSVLPVTEIAAATKRPEDVLGMHFFNPAQLMKLVELVSGELTAPETVAAADAFARSVGKETVRVKDAPGFIVNHLFIPYINSALSFYDRGMATREDLDKAIHLGLGYPMGPLELCDLIGLDTHLHATDAIHEENGDPRFVPPTILRRMVRAGRLGKKSGQGFYDYRGKGGAEG